MKIFFIFLLTLLSHLFVQNSFAQTATVNCNTNQITVTNIPITPTVYFAQVGFKDCSDGGGFYEGCDGAGQKACCRVIIQGNPVTPRFFLERLENGSWQH